MFVQSGAKHFAGVQDVVMSSSPECVVTSHLIGASQHWYWAPEQGLQNHWAELRSWRQNIRGETKPIRMGKFSHSGVKWSWNLVTPMWGKLWFQWFWLSPSPSCSLLCVSQKISKPNFLSHLCFTVPPLLVSSSFLAILIHMPTHLNCSSLLEKDSCVFGGENQNHSVVGLGDTSVNKSRSCYTSWCWNSQLTRLPCTCTSLCSSEQPELSSWHISVSIDSFGTPTVQTLTWHCAHFWEGVLDLQMAIQQSIKWASQVCVVVWGILPCTPGHTHGYGMVTTCLSQSLCTINALRLALSNKLIA